MKHLTTTVLAVVAVLGITLSGCSNTADPQGEAAATSTNQATSSCADSDMDLMETELGVWMRAKKIPLQNNSKNVFHIANGLNQFDPCAEFSWVILRGVEGPASGLAPTAFETSGDVAVFFHKDKLISKMDFLFSYEVTDIQIDGNNISVTYEQLAYPRIKQGPLDTIDYTFTGDELKNHSESTIDIRPMELDFTREPPPSDTIATPLGNKHHQPVSFTYNDNVLAEIPMGDKKLLCNFQWKEGSGQVRSEVYCENRDEPTWPLVVDKTTPIEDPKTGRNGKTNFASINFSMPSSLNTTYFAPGDIKPEDTCPDDAMIAVGPYFVDTRGDTVKISNNRVTATLGKGKAELKEEPLFKFDTSRYPKNLKPWRS